MNNIISSSGLSLCIGAALLLASCNDQEVKVNSVNVNVTEALSPERSDSVRVNVNAEYPVDGLVDSVKNSICEIIVEATFGSDYSGLSVEDAANRWAGDFVAEYKKANLELLMKPKVMRPMTWERVSSPGRTSWKAIFPEDTTTSSHTRFPTTCSRVAHTVPQSNRQ